MRIAPSAADDALAAELGFKQTAGNGVNKATIQSTTVADTATDDGGLSWEYNNAANAIFTWEKTNGSPALPEGLQGNFTGAAAGTTVVNPVALPAGTLSQTACFTSAAGCAASGAGTNEIFSAMGSNILSAGDLSSGPALPTLLAQNGGTAQTGLASSTAYMQIRTASPTVSASDGTIQLTGSHDGANKSGRVADVVGGVYTNYKGFTGQASLTLKAGDINLDGATDNSDFNIFVGKYQPGVGKAGKWAAGDFNSDGFVDNADFNIFVGGYQPGVGGGSYSPLVIAGATGRFRPRCRG